MSKLAVKALLFEALAYVLAGALLLYAESRLGLASAHAQSLPIVVVATVLFAFSVLSHIIYLPLCRKGGRAVMGFYLGVKTLRLLVAIVMLLCYAFLDGAHLLAFAVNLLTLYLAGLVVTTIFYAKAERNICKKK
ncbi:MAG: hypothetical protein ACI3YD_01985 [Alloprevotella sp.]